MTAHTQQELRLETEPGPSEAKVRRVICVVVSIVAVGAGSLIVNAEPSRPRVAATIPVAVSTNMSVVVPDLSSGDRSPGRARHKPAAKPAGFVALPRDVAVSRNVRSAAGVHEDGVARVAQTRVIADPAN